MFNLPLEVLDLILRHLSPRDCLSLCSVNRRLFHYISHHTRLWMVHCSQPTLPVSFIQFDCIHCLQPNGYGVDWRNEYRWQFQPLEKFSKTTVKSVQSIVAAVVDGERVWTLGEGGRLDMYNTTNLVSEWAFDCADKRRRKSVVMHRAMQVDKHYLYCGSDSNILVFDTTVGKKSAGYAVSELTPLAISINKDNILFSASRSIYRLDTRLKVAMRLQEFDGTVLDMAHVDDYTFAVGGRFHNVSFVDVRMNGRLLHVVHTKAHAFSMIVPQQLPFNERFLIVGGNRNGLATMEWFDLKKGIQSVRRITGGHRRGILNVAFRENSGGGLFTASMDGTVGMWDWCGRMKRCDFLDPDNGLGMCLAAELVDRDVLVAVGEAGLCRLELTPTLPVVQSYTPSPTSDEEAKDGWAMSMLLKMERSARHWFN